jgi:hydrogenase maturation protease
VRTLVLGLGNEYAGDDAVGVLAVRALRGKLAGGADVVESAASGLALLEVFAGYDRAVIADSIRTGRSPAGTIVEVRLADLGLATAPSLHQAGIPELAAVARRLGMGFPDRTRVLAVEVAGPLMFGAPLSEPVAAAVAPLGRRVLEQVQRWASEDSRCGRPAGAGRGPEDILPKLARDFGKRFAIYSGPSVQKIQNSSLRASVSRCRSRARTRGRCPRR